MTFFFADSGGWLTNLRSGVNDGSMIGGSLSDYTAWSSGTGPDPATYTIPDSTFVAWLASQGVASVRMLFSWEAVQNGLGTSIPIVGITNYTTYWNGLLAAIQLYLNRGIYVMLEPWQYNHTINDTDVTYRGATFTSTQFGQFWGPFASAINSHFGNDQRISFGMINEPHTQAEGPAAGVGMSLANWTACAQAMITQVRNTGASNTIFFPGMTYADCAGFVSNGSAAQFLTLTDPGNNLAVTVHNYNNSSGAATAHGLDTAMSALVSWSQANGNVKLHVGELVVNDGSNGDGGTLVAAQAAWANWASYVETPANNVVAWNWWFANGGGSTGAWCLNSADNVGTSYMTLIQSSLGTF